MSHPTLASWVGQRSSALLPSFPSTPSTLSFNVSRRVEPPKPRKSVGAEVNYGVRLQDEQAAHQLLDSIGACAPACHAPAGPACLPAAAVQQSGLLL